MLRRVKVGLLSLFLEVDGAMQSDLEERQLQSKRLEATLSKLKQAKRENMSTFAQAEASHVKAKELLEQEQMRFAKEIGQHRQALEELSSTRNVITNRMNRRREFNEWRARLAYIAVEKEANVSNQRFALIWGFLRLVNNSLHHKNGNQANRLAALEERFLRIGGATSLSSVQEVVTQFVAREVYQREIRAAVQHAEERLAALQETQLEEDGIHKNLNNTSDADQLQVLKERIESYSSLREGSIDHLLNRTVFERLEEILAKKVSPLEHSLTPS
eukprot:GHVN01031532.1.p2 GENE.GHVN01031532.1~~GHVN01031532.1.p2  ORF type:complete len:274 (-),score=43.48 GHVN01031532.1:1411-2232(-)